MSTTGMVMTVTDELLAELEAGINSMTMRTAYVSLIVAEIGRMRAENAGLAKDAGRYRFARKLENDCFMLNTLQRVSSNELDTAIDTAMSTQ